VQVLNQQDVLDFHLGLDKIQCIPFFFLKAQLFYDIYWITINIVSCHLCMAITAKSSSSLDPIP
jgi:hypothetical protein